MSMSFWTSGGGKERVGLFNVLQEWALTLVPDQALAPNPKRDTDQASGKIP